MAWYWKATNQYLDQWMTRKISRDHMKSQGHNELNDLDDANMKALIKYKSMDYH